MSSRVIFSHTKKVILVGILIVFIILLKNITTSIFSTHERTQILESLRQELAVKKEQEVLLTQKLSVAKTDEFVEHEARSKLGLVREGEKIVVDEGVNVPPAVLDAPQSPNWKKWLSLFTR